MNCDRETVSEMKDAVVKKLIAVGKRMGKLRCLMLVLLCIFLFLYHSAYRICNLCMKLHSRKSLARAFACFMVMVLTVTSADLTVFAHESIESEAYIRRIVKIETLPEELSTQTIMQGASFEEVQFPDSITATLMIGEKIIAPSEQESTKEQTTEKIENKPEVPETIESQPEATETMESQPEVTETMDSQPEITETMDSQPEIPETIESQPEVPEVIEGEQQAPQTIESQPEISEGAESSETVAEEPPVISSIMKGVVDLLFPAMEASASEGNELPTDFTYHEETVQIPVTWILDATRSTASEFSSETEGQIFVYQAELLENYEMAENVVMPVITVSIINEQLESAQNETIEQIEFSQNVVIDDVSISVYAPAGVFPVGASLHVEKITNDEVVNEIEQLVSNHKNEQELSNVETKVEESYTFDIQIWDENGQEIEPDTSKGQVEVVFQNVKVVDTNEQETSVYYVADELDRIEELETSLDLDNDAVSVNTEHFSIYTVVITTAIQKETILKYYQASTIQDSYFTIYTAEELARYKEILDKYFYYHTLNGDASVATVLVNADDANPMEGIVGVGQATDLKLSQLNLSAKIMDDIILEDAEWSPIYVLPSDYYINGGGKTITFKNKSGYASVDNLVRNLSGSVDNIILVNGNDYDLRLEIGILPETSLFASVTIRVDGIKHVIGDAITGAETLTISCDDEEFITLERNDDMAVYETPIENLEVGAEYHVYYAYESQNDLIPGVVLVNNTPLEELTENVNVDIDYVSVTYDLEGANTYRRNGDGTLSEDVMAAVRVIVQPNGTYKAQENYEAVLKPAEGFTIPSFSKNVYIAISGSALNYNNGDYIYISSESSDESTIRVVKEKITGPILVKVEADKRDDFGKVEVVLNTRGCGTVRDQMWDNPSTSKYTQTVFAMDEDNTITLPTEAEMNTLNGTNSISFAGWYSNMACTGNPVTEYTYNEADITDTVNKKGTKTFYAKWVLKNATDHNSYVAYEYQSNDGDIDVSGWNGTEKFKITCGFGGFHHEYVMGNLTSAHKNGTQRGTVLNLYPSGGVGGDMFKQIGSSNIWVALVCTLQGQYVDMTYIFENRGSSYFSQGLYFGETADIQIDQNDSASISMPSAKKYFDMTDGTKTFRLYVNDPDFGVDAMYSYWCGNYASQDYMNHAYHTNTLATTSDSAAAFSWHVTNIPAGGYVKKTTKLGVGNAQSMKNITATLSCGSFGSFSGGRQLVSLTSDSQKITVSADGKTVTAVRSGGNSVSSNPTRSSYLFDGWYLDEEAKERPAAGKTFTQDVKLYAKWVPDPDKSVTNKSSILRISGSDNLFVPEALANIVLYNNTPGAKVSKIVQGQTVADAAGNAINFIGELAIEGEENRYLLPDDILVELVDDSGRTIAKLTKGTGYQYTVWNNRKNATIEIKKQYIKGNIVITATGYELPPVTATSISIAPDPASTDYSITYGDTAVFTASAETSPNHVATFQWYIAPYDEITLDNFKYWTYQNQNGVALQNGTASYDFGTGQPIEVTISGANKSILRINGLPANYYGSNLDTYNNILHLGGYHLYCVVNSVRNMTGQSAAAVTEVAELQVVKNTYPTPTGLESSATTYYGGSDGEILIESQSNRPAMVYRKVGNSTWTNVTSLQINAGKISGLSAGDYQFKYLADSNNFESGITSVTVNNGRYIQVTYRSLGCDNESQRMQYQHVAYNTVLTDSTASLLASDQAIIGPAKTGYTFNKWNFPAMGVTSDTVVDAVYENNIYTISLDGNNATTLGTTRIYERYEDNYYLENSCTSKLSGNTGITVPVRKGYSFQGYYSALEGGVQLIGADGCISANMSASRFLGEATLYAHWKVVPITIEPQKDVSLEITPLGSETPITNGKYNYDTDYSIKVTNQTKEMKNVIYIFSNGQLKETIVDVVFDANKQSVFELYPRILDGSSFSILLGYVEPTKIVDTVVVNKEEEEIRQEAEESVEELQYAIIYKDVDGTRTDVDFSGSFVTDEISKGISGFKYTLPQAVKTGYTFAGWFTSSRGSGTAITEISAEQVGDITVYAKWIANKYQISYVTNGGSFAPLANIPNQFQYGGANVSLPTAVQITKANHRFHGWYDNAAGIGTPITEANAMLNHNLKYYASWEELRLYNIVLTPDGEEDTIYTYESVNGNESTQVYEGGQYSFKVNIASAYAIKSVKANGKVLTCENDIYTIDDIVDDMNVTVVVEKLANTQKPVGTIASILLPDGSTGYFESLEAAVDFATKYGSDAVICLEENLSTLSLDVPAGNAFSIDLNGKSIGTDSVINISEGAELSLVNHSETEPPAYSLTIENRGTVTNAITIDEMVNYGAVSNNGSVGNITQGQSEADGAISRFVNNGTIENMVLESGYYEQGDDAQGGSGQLPAGLTGFSTIMNGNEYYADFNDAVTIANQSDEDAEILILSDVDNTNRVVDIENTNGRSVNINLNGHSILNGNLNLAGDVSFSNSEEGSGKASSVSAKINNGGDLLLNGGVKVSGAVENEGSLSVNDAVISGNVNNHESASVDNNGTISGVLTNDGNVTNNGNMNNVVQNAGEFLNNGNVESQFVLTGGKYQVETEASPLMPMCHNTGAGVPPVMSNTSPVAYYGSIEDAIHDVNSMSEEEAPAEGLKITLLSNIEDIKESPLVISSDIPVKIDTNGNQMGKADGSDSIEISGGSSVAITDTSNPSTPGSNGKVNAGITNKAGAELVIDEDVTVSGDIDNKGNLDNSGILNGTLTNSGSGDVRNNGSIEDVQQTGGNFTNGENGDVSNMTQTGGNTENYGEITDISINGGGITGDLEPNENDINKLAQIQTTDAEGNDIIVYFSDLDSALEYAAQADATTPMTVELLQNISGETIDLSGRKSSVILDLNGHDIDSSSSIKVEENANLVILDTSTDGPNASPSGKIEANIQN